jgi:hypothetical protein
MKKLIAIASALTLLAGTVEAGSRSSGGGFRSSSRSFSRSYSAPRTYGSSSRNSYGSRSNTTVIQNHNYGGGSSGMGSGMFWGYLLGNSMASHPAPAAPSVVVVPQGASPAAPVYPNVSTVAPVAPAQPQVIEQPPEQDEGGIGFFGWLMILLGLGGAGWWTYRFMNRRAIA